MPRRRTASPPTSEFALRWDAGARRWFVKQDPSGYWRPAREIAITRGVVAVALTNGVLRGHGVIRQTGPDTFAIDP